MILLVVRHQSFLIKKTVVALVTPAGPSGWMHSSHVLLHHLQAGDHHLLHTAATLDPPFKAPLSHDVQMSGAASKLSFPSCVQLLVIVESAVVSEPAVADGAGVRVGGLVQVHVGPKMLVSTKTFVTLFTLVWPQLQMVGSHVAF